MKNKCLIKIVRSIAFNYCEGGLKAVCLKTIKRLSMLIYDRQEMLILESALQEVPSPKLQLKVRELSFQELQDIGYFKVLFFPEFIRERFVKGEECFGFFLGEKLVHIAWVTHGYLESITQFPIINISNGAGIYDCLTLPEFRRRGVYTSVLIYLQKILQQRGLDNALIAVAPDNVPSQKGIQRAGFHYLHSIQYRRMFFFLSSVGKSK